MKRFVTILTLIFVAFAASAQSENSIIIDQNSFRPLQSDALTGVNIDPIGVDSSRRPCARIKMKINRMSREDINKLDVKIVTNNQLTKCKTADYENGLILEMTAKPATRFYLNHPEFGQSNEVTLNLEPNKEYYMEASLNQTYSIVVNSNVTDAEVYLDGEYKGRTDSSNSLTIKEVFIGEHTLKLTYGNISHEQKIEVNSGKISFRQNVDTAASEPQFVVFTVEPQSAVVIINNQPYTLTDGAMNVVLDSGTYNYTVTAAGYHPQSGTFSVAGSKVSKNITLSADSATITLTAPDNAEIWVNGVKRGTSHWSGTLNSGTYIFEARKAGHKSATLSKHITSAEPRQSYTLPAPTPIVGSLIISGTPINADVTLDGKAAGQLPLKLNDIPTGEHRITITKLGYEPHTQSISILEDTNTHISIELTKLNIHNYSNDSHTSMIDNFRIGDIVTINGVQGIVFQINPHIKIISTATCSKKWKYGKTFDGIISRSNGKTNMEIVQRIKNWHKKYPAFKWCSDLGMNWYIPALWEMDAIYREKEKINQSLKILNKGELVLKDNYLVSSDEVDTDLACNRGIYGCYSHQTIRAILCLRKTRLATSSPYKIGDYYNEAGKEGIVFEVSADGKHGKIISIDEITTYWGGYNSEASTTEWSDGELNLYKIKDIRKYPAFEWCTDLGNGWYLPSINELQSIYNQVDKINQTLKANNMEILAFTYRDKDGKFLTSSTEVDKERRYILNLSNGEIYTLAKVGNYVPIRAIAKF